MFYVIFIDLPQEVDNYHELCPLEPINCNPINKAHLGYQATMYKATNIKTGVRYCLRRIHGMNLKTDYFNFNLLFSIFF